MDALPPVVAIVGRPNVGKSTLFNALTRSREALVADQPGLTRDRRYGHVRSGPRSFVVVDTGGVGEAEAVVDRLTAAQAERAAEEADALLMVVDARAGLTATDQAVADRMRALGKPLLLAVNKTDGMDPETGRADFHALGLADCFAVSAAHRRGLAAVLARLAERLPETGLPESETDRVRVCIVGRPNVGKSTLLNRLVGEDRVVAHDLPGTTRDTVQVPFDHRDRRYLLIDTAGIRRRGRVDEAVEKFSVVKALQAIAGAHVAVLVLDAREGVSEQDLRLLGHVVDEGRASVIAVNKWDGLDEPTRARVRRDLERRLTFVDHAPVHFVSALHGSGLGVLLAAVGEAWTAATRHMSTPELTRALGRAVERNPPPLVRGRRIKLRYAHQGGTNPPTVVVHGNQTSEVPESYRRYLARFLREELGLGGTPVRVELRSGENPFHGRRNPLTDRQRRKRRRLMRHVKRK